MVCLGNSELLLESTEFGLLIPHKARSCLLLAEKSSNPRRVIEPSFEAPFKALLRADRMMNHSPILDRILRQGRRRPDFFFLQLSFLRKLVDFLKFFLEFL